VEGVAPQVDKSPASLATPETDRITIERSGATRKANKDGELPIRLRLYENESGRMFGLGTNRFRDFAKKYKRIRVFWKMKGR